MLARREARRPPGGAAGPPRPTVASGSRARQRHGRPHRGLRAHLRPALGRARRPGRLDRLAVLPAVRLRRRLRRAARRPRSNGHWRLAPRGGGTCTQPALPRRHADPRDRVGHPGGIVRVIDFMPERGEAPDVVRIVEGVDGPRRDAQRAAAALRLRRRRARGSATSTACSRRSPARTPCGSPRTWPHHGRDFASYARLHRRGRRARGVRAHLEPVVPAPAGPGRPRGRAGGDRAVLAGVGRPHAPTTAPTATPSCARCSPSRR